MTHKKSRNSHCIDWILVMIWTVFTARCPPHFFQNILEEPKTKKWQFVWKKQNNWMVIFSKISEMQGLLLKMDTCYKLCWYLLHHFRQIYARSAGEDWEQKLVEFRSEMMSNISLKAELVVSEAGDNFTTNLVLHFFILVTHCAHNVPFFFLSRFNCCCFDVTGRCRLLAFSQDTTLWPVFIISHMIDHVKYIVRDKLTSFFSLIL